MGYEAFWSDESPDTVVIKATPPKDWKSFHLACDEAHTLMAKHEGPVGIIFDLRQAPDPAGRNTLTHMRKEANRLTLQQVAVVAVGYSALGRTFLQIMSKVFGSRYHATESMDDAYEFVQWRVEEARSTDEPA